MPSFLSRSVEAITSLTLSVPLKHRDLYLGQSQVFSGECSVPHFPVCLQLLPKTVKNPTYICEGGNGQLWTSHEEKKINILGGYQATDDIFETWYNMLSFCVGYKNLLINGICNSVQPKFCWLPAARRQGFGIFFLLPVVHLRKSWYRLD